jgi:membrane-associated phospholipid phosphatase
MRHGSALPLDCCLGYVLSLEYTMPSIHAMAVALLAIYASEPYWHGIPAAFWARFVRKPEETEDPEQQQTIVPEPEQSVKEARIRLLVIWLYVVLLCYARIALRLNSIWDVLIGIAMGVASVAAVARLSKLFCPVAPPVKNE